ncbi:MAG: hypothetical protein AAGA58_14940 [Verrucomicrobiota bacterium]
MHNQIFLANADRMTVLVFQGFVFMVALVMITVVSGWLIGRWVNRFRVQLDESSSKRLKGADMIIVILECIFVQFPILTSEIGAEYISLIC